MDLPYRPRPEDHHHPARPGPGRAKGEVIAIHAAADPAPLPDAIRDLLPDPERFDHPPSGAVLAIATLKDSVPTDRRWPGSLEQMLDDFTFGRHSWRLTDVQPLTVPLPCTGHAGLWTLPRHLYMAIMTLLGPTATLDPHEPQKL